MKQSSKRTAAKADEHKAVRKMLSMKKETWQKADIMADEEGTTRSAVVARAIDNMYDDTRTPTSNQ